MLLSSSQLCDNVSQEVCALVVSVPENVAPGQLLTVLAPDGSGRVVQAIVPQGLLAGHTFFVSFAPAVAVAGIPLDPNLAKQVGSTPQPTPAPQKDDNADLLLSLEMEDEDGKLESESQTDMVLVNVPPGANPGDKVRVELPDRRQVEVVVPDGGVQHFYVRIPPRTTENAQRRNWHDNPMAYGAPMLAAPLLL